MRLCNRALSCPIGASLEPVACLTSMIAGRRERRGTNVRFARAAATSARKEPADEENAYLTGDSARRVGQRGFEQRELTFWVAGFGSGALKARLDAPDLGALRLGVESSCHHWVG